MENDNTFQTILKPLAERMRPDKLEDFIGQSHLIYKDSYLTRAIQMGRYSSMIFYGPPGTGKTTLANIIANSCNGVFRKLNAVSSGVGDAKAIIEEAKNNLRLYNRQTFLLLDECHRWSKAQSDSVLQAIEEGSIIFIGSTTENPFINMTRAIVSRCRVFEFKSLTTKDILKGLNKALTDTQRGLGNLNISISKSTLEFLAFECGGDLRSAYNTLEMAVNTTPPKKGSINITEPIISECLQKKPIALGETEYYDNLSAFCKSLRGSDTDAALFYAQRLLTCGCDPLIIARRLIAHASEDVGMADSNALLICNAALESVKNVGLPECNLSLCHAIIYVCEAEKSNSVVVAMNKAAEEAEKYKDAPVPNHLKNHPNINNDGHGAYKYPHDYGGYVKQQYLPDIIKDHRYYHPSKNGREKNIIQKKDLYNK